MFTRQDMRDISRVLDRAGNREAAVRMRRMAELRIAYYFCRRCGKRHRYPTMERRFYRG